MRKEGCDENNLQPTDFLCDFCGSTWRDDRPMVEGHRGSLICSQCLSIAFDLLWNHAPEWDGKSPPPPIPPDQQMPEGGVGGGSAVCMMCLEHRDEPAWQSPMGEGGGGAGAGGAWICKRCTKQSVVMLERDPESGFTRPPKR